MEIANDNNGETMPQTEGTQSFSIADAAPLLAQIIHGDYTVAEKISAIRELRLLTGGREGSARGPSRMTREEIQSELTRLRALTGG